ncbi:unnamed protein product [Caenorhabditis bovis]|uniref:Uncharacterized protein n=1 Tax=Caenorhabditis bovis TaxID=2654633 RepID=A0A8S1F9V6_9PELO|nr:unnamed protein product [Caenorhabditis bovis]
MEQNLDEAREDQEEKNPIVEATFYTRASINCFICYKRIHGPLDNVEYFRPCKCSTIYAHKSCGKTELKKLSGSMCSRCAVPFGYAVPKARNCAICDEEKDARKIVEKSLEPMIEPCFCGNSIHFSCMENLVKSSSVCQKCSVRYCQIKYDSISTFICRHFVVFLAYIAVLMICGGFLVVCFHNRKIWTEFSTIMEIVILSIAAICLTGLVGVTYYLLNIFIPTHWRIEKLKHARIHVEPLKVAKQKKKNGETNIDIENH